MKDKIHVSLSPGKLPDSMSEEAKKFIIRLIHEIDKSLDELQESMVHAVERMKKEIADIELRLTLAEFSLRELGWSKDLSKKDEDG